MDSFATRIPHMHLLRAAAAVIAALSWVTLIWTFYDYSWGLWNLSKGFFSTSLYYSHVANLFIALYFSGVALGQANLASPRHYGHVLIIIGILFAHYWIFRGSEGFWTSPLRSKFLHGALGPLLVAFYLVLLPKGEMQWRNAATWTIFPILYTLYGMTRGALTGEYPYAVSDVEKHGYPFVLSLIAATTFAAWSAGMMLVALDKALGKGFAELALFRGSRSSAS
ncbi:MAG: Pr6Pr family membrane protein [Pseudomonadota bacterium]